MDDFTINSAIADVARIRDKVRTELGFNRWAVNEITEQLVADYTWAAIQVIRIKEARKI